MVSSTTPRFGPRCPPVWERTLINSSRTSWASCGSSCSLSALISAGERIPSSKRVGGAVVVSEESDVLILFFFSIGWLRVGRRICDRLKILHSCFAGTVSSNHFDLLFGAGQSFLTNFYEAHALFIPHNQFFQRQLA